MLECSCKGGRNASQKEIKKMKQFKTLTEKEILDAAYDVCLARWVNANNRAKARNGKEQHFNAAAKRAWERVQELSDAIIDLEREQ